jgi:hypothetical protein
MKRWQKAQLQKQEPLIACYSSRSLEAICREAAEDAEVLNRGSLSIRDLAR